MDKREKRFLLYHEKSGNFYTPSLDKGSEDIFKAQSFTKKEILDTLSRMPLLPDAYWEVFEEPKVLIYRKLPNSSGDYFKNPGAGFTSDIDNAYPYYLSEIPTDEHILKNLDGSNFDPKQLASKIDKNQKEDMSKKEEIQDHRKANVGTSNYSKFKIQVWDIWKEYKLNPWDADIVKRVLRKKSSDSRIMDYKKIIHVCQERISQLKEEESKK